MTTDIPAADTHLAALINIEAKLTMIPMMPRHPYVTTIPYKQNPRGVT